MRRYKIVHETSYFFSNAVELYPHTLRLRPREGHELRIENSTLTISPPATLRWHRDVEENSVATASFLQPTQNLEIKSEVIVLQYNQAPFDFLVSEHAVDFPFSYSEEEKFMLAPYMNQYPQTASLEVRIWVDTLWHSGQSIQTFALLLELNKHINRFLSYRIREEEGVQSAEQTLQIGTGSCRDAANLFLVAARQLGFASRFVSGYLHSEPLPAQTDQTGSTHAWAEVFIPGAGWKGFDPTIGMIAGPEHIAVAVSRLPESVPPIAGTFSGEPGSIMNVDVRVTELLNDELAGNQ